MEAIVYVTQIPARLEGGMWTPTIDLTPASEHGQVKVLLPSGLNFHAAHPVITQLREGMADYNPHNDFLLPLGDPLVMAAAAALLGRAHGRFTMLKWDRFTRTYHPYEVVL